MSFNIITKHISMPDGKEVSIETGKLAKQADGAVVVKSGNMMLLATVVANKEAKEGVDFLPLSVDYQEKFASNGRIPGSFLKREARLSDYEILISRLVDRALRPTFPDDYHADVQVLINLISADSEVLPDAFVGLAAAAALAVSDIPFNGPISEVRVAKINGEYKVNPSVSELAGASLELLVAANANDILMVEGEGDEVSETEMLEALRIAHDAIKIQCAALNELTVACGKTEKRSYSHESHNEELRAELWKNYYDKYLAVAKLANPKKDERKAGFKAIVDEYIATLPEDHLVNLSMAKTYLHDIEKEAARQLVLQERYRLDGRKLNEIRQITCEVDYLPTPHGSSVFTRGETQSLTTVTLGTKMDEQIIDQPMTQGYNKFMLHYNFPGFSTGEVKPNRGVGRREVGHGNLAMRAIKKVLPKMEDFPYTLRIVSDILESNGSSSMATVCAGTLALMDAGVKIKAPVSGIAMGLISDSKTGKYAVLSDILGDEDHLGDMDFKVTGTENGITACQMDIKVQGLSYEVLAEALTQAKEGRLHILNEMKKAMPAVREDFKPQTPRATVIKIMKDQIGSVIGPGGKVVQDIQKQSGATVTIEEKEDGGYVSIFSSNGDAMAKAVSMVRGIVTLPEVGEVYEGKVKNIQAFGAFVEFLPGKDGLLHISEISWDRIDTMDGVFKEGDKIKVKLVEVDKKTGKFRLSAKVLLPKPEKPEAPAASAE
ncbi:polyribonucleotide nucleotidyltransferase [Aquirufa antheringensis]|jgi:polyribonucleotide nucleotidyltransferase|uniref:Polyribonucleotide nucleotidyltransferase n=1 Tax=Aquirufa antheringensis TaxID=2516559 RepID=A0A4Q9BAJ3_9BACT|nr:polyribonucleotide nucleotidyltransferase [Aquirufa antheringensis]MCL9968689.1 polyribonucleotide nucleotidyltransferase [Aquirufa antheringensis]MCZ2476945.1 polyribonucleotide nucleotidyltransferase [Aquirufa antheringensis]MCZ2485840.1 polyribonucleotide nucleotidyltransferase [Aquirufa antheringensis]MCZ2486468.1 polyribonucleotide nucleotidyltransferase [Aquirufa antheringensis]MCZ2488751.1 polyribonucleotide nucleotidyltransferase [Aquirufa antheringensis]